MYRMLSSMFGSMERRVMLNGKLSAPFPVQLGVAQGAVTSPFLYACFINNLLAELDSSGLGVTVAEVHIACLAYADDIVLVAPSPQKLRALLKLLDEYAKKWRFCFNVAKSNVMVFGTKRQIDDANGEAFELSLFFVKITSIWAAKQAHSWVDQARLSIAWFMRPSARVPVFRAQEAVASTECTRPSRSACGSRMLVQYLSTERKYGSRLKYSAGSWRAWYVTLRATPLESIDALEMIY
jgi:hypothetical protein